MKKFALLASILFLPAALFGQSTLNFPRTLSTSDMAVTGFAFVNPGPADTSVTVALLSASGTLVAFSNQTVRAQGQIAKLGSELFPNATSGGWVQATSSASGIQGFWLGGDFSTYTDGANGAVSATDQILPLVAGQTEIDIANPGTAAIAVTIHCVTANGVEVSAPITETIAASGAFQSQVSAIFPAANLGLPTLIHISSPGMFAATSVVTGLLVARDTGVVNGVDTTAATLEMDFPHVVDGPLGSLVYETVVGVANVTSAAQTVTISFTSQNGGSPVSVQRSLPANGSLRETMLSLFNLSGFQDGWIKVTGTAVMTGYVAYAEKTGGGFAVVPVQVTPRTNLLFLQVADLPPWSTGIALLNTSSTAANVEVWALYPPGGLIGGPPTAATASFTLAPGQKIAKLLDPELMSAPVNGGFVLVRTTNNVPLYGVELFFAQNGSFLANVSAGTTPPGFNFVVPPIAALSSISTTQTTRGTTLTLTGSNFSTNSADDVVEFTTATGTIDVAVSSVTANTITVVIPTAAISGPVVVKLKGQPTAAYVLLIDGSATSLDQNEVTIADGKTTSGMDMYVPAPAGPVINATQVSAVAVGTTNFTFTNSVNLVRGTTMDVAVSGVGMTAANGSGISFSGEGLTWSNVRYLTSGASTIMVVTMTVDANAQVGPRDIGIKNSNLDQTILAGGIVIQ